MGSEQAPRHPGRPIVAFDFDGTLTVKDSFTAFLAWRTPRPRLISGLLRLTPAALRYVGDRDRERMKTAAVAEFLAGEAKSRVEADAEAFAEAVWSRFMRPDALATWHDWGAKGAWRVIVTASPAVTVAPFAARLGADDLLGTRLAFDAQDRVAGAFDGPNCRGPEKVARLKAAYGEDVALAAAYGDSSGDTEMIAMAEVKGMKAFSGRP
ncbi:MAG TPA: HAD-IB family hydrolase [Caulobacteraceae bacterium]|nr:HAD-IB family hydrolase [Caulobacteraceae bacterium]